MQINWKFLFGQHIHGQNHRSVVDKQQGPVAGSKLSNGIGAVMHG